MNNTIFGGTTTTPLNPNMFSGGGSGGAVDQTYNPESENAQSGKALKPILNEKVAIKYVGDTVKVGEIIAVNLADHILDPDGTYYERQYTATVRCKKECVIDTEILDVNAETFNEYWEICGHLDSYYSVYAKRTDRAYMDKDGNEIKKGFLKYYHVYSREDVVQRDNGENLPSKFHFEHFTHEEATEQTRLALDRFNRLFNYYCKKYGIEVQIVKDGTQAYFSHDMKIRVPDIHNFTSVYEYITTLAHEMVHSTGVALGRFNDKTVVDLETAHKEYSKEELVAEIGSQIVCAEMCIPDDSDTPENYLGYIQGWASYLKDKPNEIISASTKAEKASDLILECVREMELEEQKNIESEEIR